MASEVQLSRSTGTGSRSAIRGRINYTRSAAAFIIGGAEGLAQTLRERADLTLAFGAASWPHQLVRIMLLEQLYRAGTILAGHPYHRG